jgi:CTP:phosphocholine cytidylyltransferase-like protein
LIEVKGEVLIERQIRQLREAGVPQIYIVVGYMGDQFRYLEDKFGVHIVENPDYNTRNNNASIYAVKDILANTYICSSDNYFLENPFESEVSECYYAAVYADGETKEWCIEYDQNNTITDVTIGGKNAWFMLGHTFWSKEFSQKFIEILLAEYNLPKTANLLWESIYIEHINELDMKIRKYSSDVIFEFDTLDELREFDTTYISDTRSEILKAVAKELDCNEADIVEVNAYKDDSNEAAGFTFKKGEDIYSYSYNDKTLRRR